MASKTFTDIANAQAGTVTNEQIYAMKLHLEAINIACHNMPSVMGLDRAIVPYNRAYDQISELPDSADGAAWRAHMKNVRLQVGLLQDLVKDQDRRLLDLKKMVHEYSVEFLSVVSELANIFFSSLGPEEDDEDEGDEAAETDQSTVVDDNPELGGSASVPGMRD